MRTLLNWLAIGWAALLLSSMVSMMAVFLGSASHDLYGLLRIQLVLAPVALLAMAMYLAHAARHVATGTLLHALWRQTPGWLVFTVFCAALLTLIAELTFILISVHAEAPRPALEHVPAVASIVNALALACSYAHLRLTEPPAAT